MPLSATLHDMDRDKPRLSASKQADGGQKVRLNNSPGASSPLRRIAIHPDQSSKFADWGRPEDDKNRQGRDDQEHDLWSNPEVKAADD
jgi:hypothetical protein